MSIVHRLTCGTIVAMMAPWSASVAQTDACARARAADTTAVYTQCDVDRPARLAPPGKLPRYPDILRQAGVEGVAVALIDIDTGGRPIMARIRNLSSTHELFFSSLKNAVAGWRFEPAMARGALVPVRLIVEAEFGGPASDMPVPEEGWTITAAPDGIRTASRWDVAVRDSAYHADVPTRARATRVMLEFVLATLVKPSGGQKVCMADSLAGELRLTEELKEQLRAKTGIELLAPRDCPPTYASMVKRTPLVPRPAGHIDPLLLTLDTREWARDHFRHTIRIESGVSGEIRECATQRKRGSSEWRAACSGQRTVFTS